ncbi:restriction endonuclease [Methanosarcina horonobensis]|uniref:restriction endonuclease n=1 Tax=Methanosarcina horonobensis TaxID=418008 RepID=UPI000ACEAE28|nr:restriction endonuclease [Methanosarcina horonobensis]
MQQLEINYENKFSFDHLNSTQFEEFCFELLECLGFRNVNWRKGTGHASSPSDQGRDIECERVLEDVVDGELIIEKWFVECKHYKTGVPPEKIQGVLSWATSKRPDRVLIIASNFLSNQCKNSLDDYVRENRPPFKIKYWEKKDLEKVTQGHSLLLKKI